MGEFSDRVVIVTGASSGTGRATALRFLAEGANVALFARRRELLEEVASTAPDRALVVPGDAGDPEAVESLVRTTVSRFGRCDVLVNNAGMIEPRRVEDMTVESWDRMLAVNARSVFAACRAVIPVMKKQRSGAIVNVASISGVPGPQKFPGFSAYCAAKAAVISFTEALAVEVKDFGIRVNCVSPGSVDTPMLRSANADLVPDMTPEEVAEMIYFLASGRSRAMNGQNVHVFSS